SIYLTILLAFGFGYCLYITGKSAFWGPYPILVLDRKRQILYTWENNKVYMARYKDAGYATPNNNVFIKLFSFNTEKTDWTRFCFNRMHPITVAYFSVRNMKIMHLL
ncbi:hypothetical protein Q4S25_21875, partial [Morganella morganii]